jgi:transcriptional regulator with XRE-family HTH domain
MSKFYQPTPKEVKEARLFANLTQAESAELCLVTANTWARYEQGASQMPPPIWKLFEYAIAHRDASQSIKGKAKDPNAPTAEEMKMMQDMVDNWDKEMIELEAKNYAYRDGRPFV